MKYNDFFKHRNLTDPVRNPDSFDLAASGRGLDSVSGQSASEPYASSSYDYASESQGAYEEEAPWHSKEPQNGHFDRFHSRVRQGKVRLCRCGGIMVKSSRMILSAFCGVVVLVLGTALMVLYGIMTNYAVPPWYLKFALPAVYYIGAIFIGFGALFFFIRERVWQCQKCREIDKR